MTELIACIGSEKGTIAHVERLMKGQQWEHIFIIADKSNSEHIRKGSNMELIMIDSTKLLPELVDDIKTRLGKKIKGIEVAVNIVSGSGKEHMALLSAILKLGLGIRLVALTKEGVKEV